MQYQLSIRWLFICLSGLLIVTGPALAHRVTVFAWVEGDTVYGESKFSGGRQVKGGEVIVTDAEGNLLLTVQTDEQGEFSFPVPRRTALHIELKAGTGHRGEWTIPAEDIEAVAAETPPQAEEPVAAADASATGPPPVRAAAPPDHSNAGTAAAAPAPDAAAIQAAVEAALDRKLKPVIRMLAENRQEGPTVTEIFGGIGYIFGLMGVGAYFAARRKKDRPSA